MVNRRAPEPKNIPKIPKVPTKVKILVLSPLDGGKSSSDLSGCLKIGLGERKRIASLLYFNNMHFFCHPDDSLLVAFPGDL